jgi:hypothetical protein
MSSRTSSVERLGAAIALLLTACGSGVGGGSQVSAATFASGPASTDTDTDADTGEGDGDAPSSSVGSNGDGTGDQCGPLTACDGDCVDLTTDLENCGGCGITCAIPNAQAECIGGQCGLAECNEGWSNCDGELATGCESESMCVPGASCETVCGSVGVTTCTGCDGVCQTLEETCNTMDDDCNGACDEGPLPGCRIGVHRAYSSQLGHLYTTDPNEAQSGGFSLESMNFFHLYVPDIEGLDPFFRCVKGNGKRLYTTAADCEGLGAVESILGNIAPDSRCDAQPLYRVWHSGLDGHFYTTSAAERDNAVASLGYSDQGIAGYVWSSP